MPATSPTVADLLIQLLLIGLQVVVLAWLVAAAILNRRGFATGWKRGLVYGIIVTAIMMPVVIFNLTYFDIAALVPDLDAQGRSVFTVLVGSLAVGFQLLTIGWVLVCYCIAVVSWGERGRLSVLAGGEPKPWGKIALTFVAGGVFGGVTLGAFALLGVGEGEAIDSILAMFPGLDEAPVWVLAPTMIIAVSVPAFVEEVQYRGALFGSLHQWCDGKLVGVIGAHILVASIFGLMHYHNTDWPLVKFVQIFILSVVAGELTRRVCLSAGIAFHLGLNLVAVAGALIATVLVGG